MKKKMLLTTVALTMALQCSTVVYAEPSAPAKVLEENVVTLRAEETEWKFRVVSGQLQKRLWSVTYGHWIGEWINVY